MNHSTLLEEAFTTILNADPTLIISTQTGQLEVSRSLVTLFSPLLSSLLSTTTNNNNYNTNTRDTIIIMPDVSARSVHHIMEIITRGTSCLDKEERREPFRIVDDALLMGLDFDDVTICKIKAEQRRERDEGRITTDLNAEHSNIKDAKKAANQSEDGSMNIVIYENTFDLTEEGVEEIPRDKDRNKRDHQSFDICTEANESDVEMIHNITEFQMLDGDTEALESQDEGMPARTLTGQIFDKYFYKSAGEDAKQRENTELNGREPSQGEYFNISVSSSISTSVLQFDKEDGHIPIEKARVAKESIKAHFVDVIACSDILNDTNKTDESQHETVNMDNPSSFSIIDGKEDSIVSDKALDEYPNDSDVQKQSETKPKIVFLSDIPTREKRGNGQIKCDKCETKFKRNSCKQKHLKTVHGERKEKSHECILCSKRFASKHRLTNHEERCFSRGGERKVDEYLQCTFCEYKLPRKSNVGNLKNHIRFYHDKIFDNVCDICGYKAFTNSILKLHILSLHENKKWPCDICGKEFSSPGAVKKHDQIFHNVTEMFCDSCDFVSASKTVMKHHKEKIHLGIRYKCEECTAEYSQQDSLQAHILMKHKGVKYPCDSCSKIFSSGSSRLMHKKTKHLNININCPECPTSHASRSHLKLHIESKHENIKYPCDECNAKLASAKSLKNHKDNVHTDEKIVLKCKLCTNEYWTKGSLKQHILTKHDGVRYPCRHCSFQASHPSSLLVHEKTMHVD